MIDRICGLLAESALTDSHCVVYYRRSASDKGLAYKSRLLFDLKAADAEARMIDRANMVIERLERQA